MSRMLVASALTASLCVCVPARGAEHSWEISGALTRHELDILLETDRSLVGATYYFDPVDDGSGPLGLAAFFDPATRVSAAVSHEKATSHAIGTIGPIAVAPPELVNEEDEYTVAGRYVFAQSKWYVGGTYTVAELDSPPLVLEPVTDSDVVGLLAGKYLGAATTVELRVDRAELTAEGTGVFCTNGPVCMVGGRSTTERVTDGVSLDAMHVRQFRSLTYAFSGRVAATSGSLTFHRSEFTFPPFVAVPRPPFIIVPNPPTVPASTAEVSLPRSRSYAVAGELFPTTRIGVRIGYTRFDDETPADDAYDVGATWFFTRKVGIEFAYAQQSADARATFRRSETAFVRVLGRL